MRDTVGEPDHGSVSAGSYPAPGDCPGRPQQDETTASDPDEQALEELKEILTQPAKAEEDALPDWGRHLWSSDYQEEYKAKKSEIEQDWIREITDPNEVNFDNEENQRCYGRPQCSGSRLDIGPRIAMSLHWRVRTGLEWHRSEEAYLIKDVSAPQGWRKPEWKPMEPLQEIDAKTWGAL